MRGALDSMSRSDLASMQVRKVCFCLQIADVSRVCSQRPSTGLFTVPKPLCRPPRRRQHSAFTIKMPPIRKLLRDRSAHSCAFLSPQHSPFLFLRLRSRRPETPLARSILLGSLRLLELFLRALFEIKENIRNVNVNLALRSSDTASSPVTIVSNGILHDGHRKCQRNLKPTNILAAIVKLILTRASKGSFYNRRQIISNSVRSH